MITGAIAVFIIVVCVVPAISNGEVGTAVLGGVIALLLLFFGMVSRADDRAYVNRLNYWSSSGKERAKMRHKWEAEAKEEEELRSRKHQKTYDQIQAESGLTKVGNDWTAGKVSHMNTTYPCPTCGSKMNEDHRIEYSSGAVYVTYRCGKCRKELPVRVK